MISVFVVSVKLQVEPVRGAEWPPRVRRSDAHGRAARFGVHFFAPFVGFVIVMGVACAVFASGAAHDGSTLADLYDPKTMPPDLRKAHTALDKAVDQLYRKAPFANDRERVEHLFALYEKLVASKP